MSVSQRDLRKVRTAVGNVKKAEQRLIDTIIAAHRSGESIRDIAPHAELSPSRIHQILREQERLKPTGPDADTVREP